MKKLVERLKALGDENRLKIVMLLSKNQICAKGLSSHLDISESAVSQHIKILKNADLLTGKKVGYYVHYTVEKNILNELKKLIGELANDSLNFEKLEDDFDVVSFDCQTVCNKKGSC